MDINEFLESLAEEGITIDIKEKDKEPEKPTKKKRDIINDPAPDDPKPLKPMMIDTMKGITDDEEEDGVQDLDEAPKDEEGVEIDTDKIPDVDEVSDEEAPEEEMPPEEGGEEMPADDGMGDMEGGADAGMGDMEGGFGQEEDPNDPTNKSEVGRLHELKKIHSRLSSLDMYLSSMLDPKLIKLKELVSKSRDLFHTVVSNFGMYKENIDEIIVTYYKFLDEVFELLVKYYKSKKDKI